MRLAGKVAIITGSGSGQGRAAAKLFARQGASVAVSDVNIEGAEETVTAIRDEGGDADLIACDVSDATQVEALVKGTVRRFGGLHVLYNNAGAWFLSPEGYRPGETDAPFPLLEANIWQRTID